MVAAYHVQPACMCWQHTTPIGLLSSFEFCTNIRAQGGEFITQIKDITGAKLSVDKTIQGFDERVAHIESSDT